MAAHRGAGGRGGCTAPDRARHEATANASRSGVNLPSPSLPYVPRPRVSQGSCSRLGSPPCEQAHPLPDWIYSPACTHPRAPRRRSLAAPAPPLQGTRLCCPGPSSAPDWGGGPSRERGRVGRGLGVGIGHCCAPSQRGRGYGAVHLARKRCS